MSDRPGLPVRSAPVLLLAAVAAMTAACGAGSSPGLRAAGSGAPVAAQQGGPVHRQPPRVAPAARMRGEVCLPRVALVDGSATGALATVDPGPVGVTAVWLPGLNFSPCRAVLATYGSDVAARLAADVRAAARFPKGTFTCPMAEGSAVDLYFSYRSGPPELVRANLSGCRTVTAPGRWPRRLGPEIDRDLASLRPPAWRAISPDQP